MDKDIMYSKAIEMAIEKCKNLSVDVKEARDYNIYFTKKGESKHCCGIVVRSKDYKVFANTTEPWFADTKGIDKGLTRGNDPWRQVFFENVSDAVDELVRYLNL